MAAGAPLLKVSLTRDEATNLQKQLGLDPQQKQIFPDMLRIVLDSEGIHSDVIGLPIQEFRYTVVGDVVTPREQEMIRAQAWQGFQSALNQCGSGKQRTYPQRSAFRSPYPILSRSSNETNCRETYSG